MKHKNKIPLIFRKRITSLFGVIIIVGFILSAIFANQIAPYSAVEGSSAPFEAPSLQHWVGTNDVGVDILSELIHSARISLTIGFACAAMIVFAGTVIGTISGYFGGYVDNIIMRVTDIFLILPRLPLMIVMAAYLGPSMITIIFVITFVGWATMARQIRAQVYSVKEYSFIEAAKSLGASDLRIIISHILPNIWGVIIANAIMEVMFSILIEAGMSFLGLGDPIHKSWGVMLYFAQTQGAFLLGAWWWIIPPGLCIAIICICFNYVGTAVNDIYGLKLESK